ncbi:hypothetical protein Tco_0018891 [Tanacetum coccineum]
MLLQRSGLTNEEHKHSETFAKWLLDVGDDEIGEPEEEDQDNSWIIIPPEYSVDNDETSLSRLNNFIYDDTTLKTPTAGSLNDEVIPMGSETSEKELLFPTKMFMQWHNNDCSMSDVEVDRITDYHRNKS